MLRSMLWVVGLGLFACGCLGSKTDRPLVLTGDELNVVGSLVPDVDCIVSTDSALLLKGRYDVLESSVCDASYDMYLLVESRLIATKDHGDGVDPHTVQITSARVTLRRVDDSLVDTGALPNPFDVVTNATIPPGVFGDLGNGVALVEAIPSSYREHLRALGDSFATIVAEVQLTATALSGSSAELATYRFPIQLCLGCYALCSSDFSDDALQALTDGICNDNAGADGRVCIDSGC